MNSVKSVSNCGFTNQDFDWNIMSEEGMPQPWMSPGRLEELRLNFKANKNPLQK